MADMKKFSEQVIDVGERIGNVADAAKGKDGRSPRARWLLLPAAGAGLYALATSGAFARRASGVVKEVRVRASDLPDELMSRVHDATSSGTTSSSGNARRSAGGTSRSGNRRRTKARASS
jgi:hypothetical protein